MKEKEKENEIGRCSLLGGGFCIWDIKPALYRNKKQKLFYMKCHKMGALNGNEHHRGMLQFGAHTHT